MNLRDYHWFNNPRGLHNAGPYAGLDVERYLRAQMGWARLLCGGTEYVEQAAELVRGGCMPVVRIFRESTAGTSTAKSWYQDLYRPYLEAGVQWFDLYDAPNLPEAWPQNSSGEPKVEVHWKNRDGVIVPLMDNWLDWAEQIIILGGYPGFPPLVESVDEASATIRWANAMLTYLLEEHESRFRYIIDHGLWFSTRPDMRNHFYQEPGGGPSYLARSYTQYRAEQGGWHFEHPYDPVQQAADRGRTVFGGTPDSPYGAPQGLIATGQIWQNLLKRHFQAGPLPVLGTSGGILPMPGRVANPQRPNPLYPPVDYHSHTEATLALYEWIVMRGPPWFWGLMLSDETTFPDSHPVITRMVADPAPFRDAPDIDPAGRKRPTIPAPPELDLPPAEPTTAAGDLFAMFDQIAEEHDAPFSLLDNIANDPLDASEELDPELLRLMGMDTDVEEAPQPPPEPIPASEVRDPQPGESLTAIIIPFRIDYEPGFLNAQDYAAAVAAGEYKPAPLELPTVNDLLEAEPEQFTETPSEEEEPDEGDPEGGAFFALLDEIADDEPAADERSPLDRFEAMLTDDGTQAPTTIDERNAPDFFEIVEELTGRQPTRSTGLSLPDDLSLEEPKKPAVRPLEFTHEPDAPETVELARPIIPDDEPGGALTASPSIMGEPHHFLLIAADIEPDWVMEHARPYWEAFRPTVLTDWRLLTAIPPGTEAILTVLTHSAGAYRLSTRLRLEAPHVIVDMITSDDLDAIAAELQRRTQENMRFG